MLKYSVKFIVIFILLFNGASPHPLDPLTQSEMNASTQIIKADPRSSQGDFMFNYIVLKEPPKALLLPYFLNDTEPPDTIPRRSTTVLLDRATNQAYEVIVNLNTGLVESWISAPPGVTPTFTVEELHEAERVVRLDPRVIERCAQQGWPNTSMVMADPWSIGYIDDLPQYRDKRMAQFYFYGKYYEDDNYYTHPLDFMVAVDLLKMEVVGLEDLPTGGTSTNPRAKKEKKETAPRTNTNYDPVLRSPDAVRNNLNPIKVTQSEKSFTVLGNQVSWDKFKLRIGFNGREGMVLYNLNYNDSGIVRPLFYRMSLAEMFVPYGDPRSPYYRKHVFDEGQFGIGVCANTLQAQMDCLGEVHFIDTAFHNENGEAEIVPQVVCIHEIEDGILWKHTNDRTGKSTIVRNQRLALTFIATVGNYDYVFTWKFSLDGTIEFHVQLTGILSLNVLADGATPGGHGSVVAPGINALYHQHLFALRLDPEIDGNQNSVTMVDVVDGPGGTGSATNPYGQAWTAEKTPLTTAGAARTNIAPEKSRVWVITNPGSNNPYTESPVGWRLSPYPSAPMLLQQDSPIHPAAAWMDYNTWVTPYHEDQMFPGGFYLNKSGLPEWVGNNPNANVEDTDIVLWHNFGLSHVPRIEDFPIMPMEEVRVILKPYNFFLENPSMDVPPVKQGRSEL